MKTPTNSPVNSPESSPTNPLLNILVRLPNWLGDVVLSAGFVRALHQRHPQARLHLVSKAALAPLLPALLPAGADFRVHPFAKKDWPGVLGPWRFGRQLRRQAGPFARYYCLPDSFSTALLGLGSGAAARVGYAAQGRGLLLTHRPAPPAPGQHRADGYTRLLGAFAADASAVPPPRHADVRLTRPPVAAAEQADAAGAAQGQATGVAAAHPAAPAPLLLNFNSEAPARRMPAAKAAALIAALRRAAPGQPLALLGAAPEAARNAAILALLPPAARAEVQNLAGRTDLPGLLALLQAAPLLLSTDSGPAHVANALGTPLVVCFGPGDEARTGPYHPARAVVARAPGPVPCGGCTNVCRFGAAPPCLLHLDEAALAAAVQRLLRA